MTLKGKLKVLLVSMILLCSCEREDVPEINGNPSCPIPKFPGNYSLLNDKTVNFTWEASEDPEGEEVTYHLQLSANADFTQILFSDAITSPSHVLSIPEPGFYFWRVRAKDNHSNTSEFSKRQNFSIADPDITNYAPFPPELSFPELDEAVNLKNVELGWSGFDIDNSHLLYNIYVGTEYGHQSLYAEHISNNEITVTLKPSQVYYWKVRAIDPHGKSTESPVWWFKSK